MISLAETTEVIVKAEQRSVGVEPREMCSGGEEEVWRTGQQESRVMRKVQMERVSEKRQRGSDIVIDSEEL